ncbi:MAG TPA: hypothetical protein VGM51_13875 [Armatimonadota bacterium]|jgi:hypothetical protein
MKRAAVRKRAQRAVPAMTTCEDCGAVESLQRHHPDYSQPETVVILCQDCHAKRHVEAGTWGHGSKVPRSCAICGTEFIPKHSKKGITCSRPCLSELGRRNAQKRWGGGIKSPTSRVSPTGS